MLRVPIKSYLRKFIIGKLESESIILRKITDNEIENEHDEDKKVNLIHCQRVGNIIFGIGLFKSKQAYYDKILRVKYNDYIGIDLNDNMLRKKLIYIDMRAVYNMNDRLYDWFVYDFILFMDAYISNKGKFQDGIIEFMSIYNLEFEDIGFEALKRALSMLKD